MRAPRFPLQLEVRYRPEGVRSWRRATTGNVSSSGVLVRVPDPLKVNTRIEFRLALKSAPVTDAAEVSGRGRVVRQTSETEASQRGFAIAIDEYDFKPTQGAH
jgi:hypothetical protein